MRHSLSSKTNQALTLVELLLTIAILGVLFALLLPSGSGSRPALIARARSEEDMLKDAVQRYRLTYGSFPITQALKSQADAIGDDLTVGGPELGRALKSEVNFTANAEVVAILLDLTSFPDGRPTVNSNYVLNPQRIKFLNAQMVADVHSGGVGPDLVYRDPWGNPYIISMDLNGDGKVRDAFYRNRTVSQSRGSSGFLGLTNAVDSAGSSNTFEINGQVMVWSLGPDGKADVSQSANEGVNKDNFLSWRVIYRR